MRTITQGVRRLVGGEDADADDDVAFWHGVEVRRILGRAVGVTGRPR